MSRFFTYSKYFLCKMRLVPQRRIHIIRKSYQFSLVNLQPMQQDLEAMYQKIYTQNCAGTIRPEINL